MSAAASGGALFGNSGANLLIAYGSVMSGNAAMTGGGVHCDSCQQLTMTTGTTVESNHAAQGGGACCLTCECVLFQDVHFLNNRYATGLLRLLLLYHHLRSGLMFPELSKVLCICCELAAHVCEQHGMLHTPQVTL